MELQATTFDAIQMLTRHFINANSEQQITDEFKHYPRPAALRPPVVPENTVTLAGFAGLLKEKI